MLETPVLPNRFFISVTSTHEFCALDKLSLRITSTGRQQLMTTSGFQPYCFLRHMGTQNVFKERLIEGEVRNNALF